MIRIPLDVEIHISEATLRLLITKDLNEKGFDVKHLDFEDNFVICKCVFKSKEEGGDSRDVV